MKGEKASDETCEIVKEQPIQNCERLSENHQGKIMQEVKKGGEE